MNPSDNETKSVAPHIGRSVSLDHAAEMLGVSRRTIYNRIREGRLQTVRTLGSSKRVLLQSVLEIRERGGVTRWVSTLGDSAQTTIGNQGEGHMNVKTQIKAGSGDDDSIIWGN